MKVLAAAWKHLVCRVLGHDDHLVIDRVDTLRTTTLPSGGRSVEMRVAKSHIACRRCARTTPTPNWRDFR